MLGGEGEVCWLEEAVHIVTRGGARRHNESRGKQRRGGWKRRGVATWRKCGGGHVEGRGWWTLREDGCVDGAGLSHQVDECSSGARSLTRHHSTVGGRRAR